jgi:hypothetical protein
MEPVLLLHSLAQARQLTLLLLLSGEQRCLMPVAHTCNSSYLGGWDWEDHFSRPAGPSSSRDPISKITTAKWTGGVAQVVKTWFASAKPWVQSQSNKINRTENYQNRELSG